MIDPKEKMLMKTPFRHYVSLLRTYLKPQSLKVILLTVLLFVSIGLEILNPQLLGLFINSVQSSTYVLVRLALLFIGLVIANQLNSN